MTGQRDQFGKTAPAQEDVDIGIGDLPIVAAQFLKRENAQEGRRSEMTRYRKAIVDRQGSLFDDRYLSSEELGEAVVERVGAIELVIEAGLGVARDGAGQKEGGLPEQVTVGTDDNGHLCLLRPVPQFILHAGFSGGYAIVRRQSITRSTVRLPGRPLA